MNALTDQQKYDAALKQAMDALPKDASAWIERVLLPELNTRYDNIYNQNNVFKGLEKLEQLMSIKQFILSHRDEWKQE